MQRTDRPHFHEILFFLFIKKKLYLKNGVFFLTEFISEKVDYFSTHVPVYNYQKKREIYFESGKNKKYVCISE